MIIEQHNSTAIISQDKTTITEFSTKLSVLYERFKEVDVIVQLNDATAASMDSLVSLSETHRLLNHSFVVVSTQLNQDDFEDNFSVVPTLQEAHDYIEMETLERDLGI
tara:strand:+ start:1431 stop:1754 length:324 start_codon:yes stop_codon:yes gene_type:complete